MRLPFIIPALLVACVASARAEVSTIDLKTCLSSMQVNLAQEQLDPCRKLAEDVSVVDTKGRLYIFNWLLQKLTWRLCGNL